MSPADPVQRLIDALNPEQRAAVVHRGGPVLVLAGAGTGKTRVITVRIAALVAHDHIAPEHVLALTFTNKAAGEMRERVAHFLGRDAADKMTIGTFHSLGLRMVERDAKKLGFRRGVAMLDAADQASAVRQCLKQLRIDPKRHDPRAFLTTISNARNAGLPPEHFLDGQPNGSSMQLTGKVYQAYLRWLEAYQAMDFDDLILRANQLLREHGDVLVKWRQQFRTILVDEYQDTNIAQLDLVRALADEHRQLCVVGDDDQSIYGWRGADVRNILEFERHFPDATAVALTRNYRSTGHILSAANAVIGHNDARREKSLWTDIGEGEPVRVVTAKDPAAEASYVAAEIVRKKGESNGRWQDFGVLFRTSAQAKPIEEAFRLAGVPYRLVGAYEFFERKEVKDILSYLKLAVAPHDEVALLRVVNFPQRGIGPGAIEALHAAAHARHTGLWDVVRDAGSVPRLGAGQVEALRDFVKVIDELRTRHERATPVGDLATWLCERLGAREAWLRDPTEGPGGEGRWRNVESLIEGMRAWQERKPHGELRDYLRVVALDSRDASGDAGEEDKVALLTLHAAKGLEWPFCFVIGCQEGILPHQRVVESEDGDLAEERRLFYVGITRARRVCYLTLARGRYTFHGTEPSRPSRFLREVPAAHRVDVDRLKAVEASSKSEVLDRFKALKDRLGKR
ncbi:MAG: UvrD-helicase domain-containing protein [Deltaproteobacteria bacterium]|nr:UvrD-helicase domain-containing protein [Deltaproteobacteria bacterium]